MSRTTRDHLGFSIPRYRDLWRFRAPLTAGEIRRTERWLATARVALTIATLITLWMEPGRGVVYSFWLYWLLTVYLVHAVVGMLLVRFRRPYCGLLTATGSGRFRSWKNLPTVGARCSEQYCALLL